MTIGEIIKAKRDQLGLTLEEVGTNVGVDRATVMRWEKGQIQKMGRDKIAALASVLQLDPVLFVQPADVLMSDERQLLSAYRAADDSTKKSIRKLLDIPEDPRLMVDSNMFDKKA